MVLGLLFLTTVPTAIGTTIGTAQAISANKREQEDTKRSAYCGLRIYCSSKSSKRQQIHNKWAILRNDKMYIDDEPSGGSAEEGTSFNGFYINFPNDEKPMGMVSMTSLDPPAMGWIYVDRETAEVKYGNRSTSMPHIVGPWDWTEDEVGVTLAGKEAFVAVEEDDCWAVYYDRKGDLKKLPKGRRKLEISLERLLKPKDEEPAK